MTGNQYDVVIVGGGMGGLNLGALLAHAGKKVLILEKGGRESLGGRAASGKIKGSAVDNGIKGLILAGSQDEIYRRIGKEMPENVCEWTNHGQIHTDGRWRSLEEVIGASMDEFMRVYKETAMTLGWQEIEALNDISTEEWVQSQTDDQNVIDFFRYMGWLFGGTLAKPTDYSVGSLFYSVKKQIETLGKMPWGSYWVKGGSGAIAPALIEAIEENGGEIRTHASVSRIVVEQGRATGVEVDVGERAVPTQLLDVDFISADVVVSAVAIWDIFNILSEDDLAPWYAQRLEYLHRRTLNVATVTYCLNDATLFDDSGIRWVQQGPKTGRPWCASTLDYSENPGEYEVTFWIQMGWWEKPNLFEIRKASHKAALRELFEQWEEEIKLLFPGVVEKSLWRMQSFGPATIMESPGLVGDKLIDVEAEGVAGLYLIGERTKEAKVMGVYGSAQTALATFDKIMQKFPVTSAR
jgi:phytoene dehydrogenase-like protein